MGGLRKDLCDWSFMGKERGTDTRPMGKAGPDHAVPDSLGFQSQEIGKPLEGFKQSRDTV